MRILQPVLDRIAASVLGSDILHADDTPIRVLAHGVEELTDMLSQARLTTKVWHQFLDDFVNHPELATRFKAEKLR